RLAEACDSLGQSRRARDARRWARVAPTEPLNRVVLSVGDADYELDETPSLSGNLRFRFERNRTTLHPARAFTALGEEKASGGDFEAGLEAFRRAAEADPYDPHSRYLAALTLLHLKRYSEATALYAQTEVLAPGWFQCRHDAWLAARLGEGSLAHEQWLALVELEDRPDEPPLRLRRVQNLLEGRPDLAVLHFQQGKTLAALGQGDRASESFERAMGLESDPDLRTRCLVQWSQVAEASLRQDLLRQAADLNGNLVAGAMATVLLRATG
ncbi:MAG: tetratricopeptide repeat protein, partial [Candidatus Eremiobacterota bacterium]